MRHSSILLPILGATLLSFSVASAQQAATHETEPAKEGTQTKALHAKQMKHMVTSKTASKSAMMTNQRTSKMATKAVRWTKRPAVTNQSPTLTKAAKQSGKKTSAHTSQTKTSKISSRSAQHVKHSIKDDRSQTQKKSKS